jgi:dihydroflavonol-4-reductase
VFTAKLEDEASWNAACKGCTYVIHCASPWWDEGYGDLILASTKFVVNAAYECGVKRFIYTSSYETTYEDPDSATMFTENCKADSSGKDSYVLGKIESEKYLEIF